MTAEEARALSYESIQGKYLRLIKELALEARYSVCIADGDEMMKHRSFLESLGYKVRLLSEFDPDTGLRWRSPTGEISWGQGG